MNRRRVRLVPQPSVGAPISELNTTPLIDVMLVLLIMFIVTIPIATHGVEIDLPTRPDVPAPEPQVHRLVLDRAGGLTLDGAPIAGAAIRTRLEGIKRANPLAILHFQTEGAARYEDFDRVLAEVKKAGVERLGFVGNHDFAASF
jgi:biopolymer transport protein ExbD